MKSNDQIFNELKEQSVFWRTKQEIYRQLVLDKQTGIKPAHIKEIMMRSNIVKAVSWLKSQQREEKVKEPHQIIAIKNKWQEITEENYENEKNKPIFTWKTLYSLIQTVKNEKIFELKVDRRRAVQNVEILMQSQQLGFSQEHHEAKMYQKTIKILESKAQRWKIATQLRDQLQKGIPTGLRTQSYLSYFQATSPNQSNFYKSSLDEPYTDNNALQDWFKHSIDKVMDDEAYFLFKQGLIKIIKTFTTDSSVAQYCAIGTIKCADGSMCIIPFGSFAYLVSPFFYCSTELQTIYWLFRQMYTRRFVYLSSLTSSSEGILYLCNLFQDLLRKYLREVHLHLLDLGLSAVKLVFRWLFFSFVGTLDVQQVFQLFDRIISLGNQVLVFLALGILTLKEQEILMCDTEEQVQETLNDLEGINFLETVRLFLVKINDGQ